MFVHMLVALALVLAGALPAQRVTLHATPARIRIGDSAVVSWEISPGASAFLSALGVVESSGHATVRPTMSTSYVLVVEDAKGIMAREVAIAVDGVKGDGEFPDRSEFRSPFSYRQAERSLPQFLLRAKDALQNDLRHSIRAYNEDTQSVIETNRRERGDLVRPTETHIGARRIAYRLTVHNRAHATDAVEYVIETFVQFRLLRERTWRDETDPAFGEGAARALAQALKAGPSSSRSNVP